ncbi:MAG TPA: carbon-nitrogen hydrolase family protein [Acidimicrobiales bacterium]
MSSVRVAAIQMTSGSDVAANEAAMFELLERASDQGATYLQLPEYCTYWGPRSGYDAAAKGLDDGFVRQLGLFARGRKLTVHLGSMLEPAPDGRFFNTSVVIGPRGDVTATYRKTHLFDAQPPGGVTYYESEFISPGSSMRVVGIGEMHLGLSVCFDVRFAELYRALVLAGANVLAIPAAFSAHTGPAHWEVLVRARAIENHVFVIAATQAGVTLEGLATHGHSMIVGPWGEILAQSSLLTDDVLVTDIDLGDVDRRRGQIEVLRLRRPDVYGTDVEISGD